MLHFAPIADGACAGWKFQSERSHQRPVGCCYPKSSGHASWRRRVVCADVHRRRRWHLRNSDTTARAVQRYGSSHRFRNRADPAVRAFFRANRFARCQDEGCRRLDTSGSGRYAASIADDIRKPGCGDLGKRDGVDTAPRAKLFERHQSGARSRSSSPRGLNDEP